MRPRTIPKTPVGRWAALTGDGYALEEHQEHAHEAAMAFVREVSPTPGDLIDVGRIVSTEELIDGARMAGLVLEDLTSRVHETSEAAAEGWPTNTPRDVETRARNALETKLRGAVMAYLIETSDFPPPWYASPERCFEYSFAGPEELETLYQDRKIRGQDPEEDAEDLGPEFYVLREVAMIVNGPEGEAVRDYVGPLLPSPELEAYLEDLIREQAADAPPARTSSVCRAEGCAEDARGTRTVEDEKGQDLELELCQGHLAALDAGKPIAWNGTPVEKVLEHERAEEGGLEV